VPGWAAHVRALRSLLTILHSRSPSGVPGGSEQLSLELIEMIEELDARSLHLLRLCFAELFKLSNH
jgi:hypothetical protein